MGEKCTHGPGRFAFKLRDGTQSLKGSRLAFINGGGKINVLVIKYKNMNFENKSGWENIKEIRLTEDENITDALKVKLEEYKERAGIPNTESSKGKNKEKDLDSFFKYLFLSKLLKDGVVNKDATYDLMDYANAPKEHFDQELWDNAFGVIEDYNATGGKNNKEGTGLKI